MSNESKTKGSCLCGAIHISVKAMSKSVGVCHCNMCRKWTGGPLMAVDCGSDVSFDGEKDVSVFNSSEWGERGFCNKCGSNLFYRLKQNNQYMIPIGLFDDCEAVVFDHQVFIDEKPSFYSFANETQTMTGAEVFAQYAPSSE